MSDNNLIGSAESASESKDDNTKVSRRNFLGTAAAASAAAGATALGFPAIVTSQSVISWRFQSTWPSRFLYQECAVDWTKKVEELTNGRLKISMMSAGSVVPGLQIIDASNQGVLDGGHGLPGFWFGKNSAFGLYGAGPDFGMTGNEMLGWIEYGGGMDLYREIQQAARINVESFLLGPVPPEPMGWFKHEIKELSDMKGLRFRTAGLAVDMFRELGLSPVQMAPADIIPALDRGLLDAAEFASATDDRTMGFPDVAKFYIQHSYHMANNVCEVMINRRRYDALSDELKLILKHAAHAASADMHWKNMHRMSQDYIELQKDQGVTTYRTPQPILDAQLQAWNAVIEKHSAENPLFAKVVKSQMDWARRVVYWQNEVSPSKTDAYTHYFGKGPGG
ncbi:MAG: TRAP transporter substrate-binding protein [Aquisalimonadaceae bacterium]